MNLKKLIVSSAYEKEADKGLRIWFEGQILMDTGFHPGTRYNRVYDIEARTITLQLDTAGKYKVSSSKRNSKDRPIIDIYNKENYKVFKPNDKIKAEFRLGLITISVHCEQSGKEEREKRFKERTAQGLLKEASLFTGGGISTEAIALATKEHGFKSKVVWVAEMEHKYIEAAEQNCRTIDDQTVVLVGTVEEIESKYYTECDVLSFSMPCAGFSKAGKSKHKMTSEQHSGTALFGVVNAIRAANPAVIVSENVTEAQDSPIYTLLKSELMRLGYALYEHVLDNTLTGSIETRKRYWLVAVSEGLAPATWQLAFDPKQYATRSIRSILDNDIPESMWCDNDYLKDKAVRDADAGKGFRRQLLTGKETTCGTIGRFYAKKRSTEPFVVRADGKERLFTPAEHARVKSVPEYLIADIPTTTAHEILGQSVDFQQPFQLMLNILRNLVAPVDISIAYRGAA